MQAFTVCFFTELTAKPFYSIGKCNIGYALEPTHDSHHQAVFYASNNERLTFLAAYFKKGFEANELCILVSELSRSRAINGFRRAGLDITPYLESGQLRIFMALQTYLGDGRFVAAFMLQNVQQFSEEAERQGFRGLRTAGDMSWLSDHQDAHDEAMLYENQVDDFIKYSAMKGLCLYSLEACSPELVKNAMHAHPRMALDYTSYQKDTGAYDD